MAKALIHVGVGDDRETHEYRQGKLLNVEFGAIERVTGLVGGEVERALEKGGINAITALIWVLRKRTQPRLRLEEVVFTVDELMIEIVNDDGSPIEDDDDDDEPVVEAELESEPEAPKAAKKATGSSRA